MGAGRADPTAPTPDAADPYGTGTAIVARERRIGQAEVVLVLMLAVLLGQRWIVPYLQSEVLSTWATMFVAVVVQSVPFLIFGVILAAVISTFISERALARVAALRPSLAVPAAGVAGIALPGCECASVPVAGSLIRRGVLPAAALTFMLAAPAVNPVVVVSTAVAFPGQPEIVVARFAASLLTAVVVGWVWVWRGGRVPILASRRGHDHRMGFLASCRHDFLQAAGFLVAGAMIAAAVNTLVPREIVDTVAGQAVLAVLTMALLAFLVAMCSEADAFVAASLTAFSDSAKLVFMVVGPAMDVKLAAMQVGTFGRPFAARFVPLVVAVALLCAVAVGWLLL